MMSRSERELERFFAELSPRLETARSLDRQLARQFSVFRYLRTDEMGLSRMIADLLDPNGDHGQGPAFLRCLTERLGFAKGVNLAHAKVSTEHHIDGRRLDIVVQVNGEHCLAIENKSNFAGDRDGQVEAYLKGLKRHFGEYILVYLSPTGLGPSEESVAPETVAELKATTPRRFVIMPCRASSETPDDEFDDLRLPFSLVDWLADCRRECDVDRLRWYLREAETHCQQRYGGSTVTTRDSAVADSVLKDKRNVATALDVHEAWPAVARKIKCQFMELIYNNLPSDMEGDWDYSEKRYKSYIYIYRQNWRPYVVDGEERRTVLCMEAQGPAGTNWAIGVSSPRVEHVLGHRERREKLDNELGRLGKKRSRGWPCYEFVDDKYRNWDSLIPEMYEELQVDGGSGGEITAYFVGKFEKIANETLPIIDRIEGG